MGVSFTDPLWWLVLPVVLWLAWYLRLPWLRMQAPAVQKRREKRRLYTRLALLVLLVAVLAGPGLVSVVNRQAVILALDQSASVGPAASEGERWVRDILGAKPPDTLAGVVSFGQQALVEEPPGMHAQFYRATTEPGPEASRIDEALHFSGSIMPQDARQRVVLLTDGRETDGGAVAAARMLKANGVRVDVVPVGAEAGPDIRMIGLNVASQARVGDNTVLEVTVKSDVDTEAELYLERDGALLASRPVELRPGDNRMSFSVPAGEAGMHRYRVRVMTSEGANDAFSTNNEAGAIQEVAGSPRVLVLAQNPGEAGGLAGALRASGQVEVTVAEPGSAPRGITEWARYQAVFLVNVPAFSLGEGVMSELETYVRDGGGGLVMVGGPDSFGPGGYSGTPVERALPVEMDIKGRGELPSLGLVLVIDKSGSMGSMAGGGDKMALAREAAVRSISVLTDRDQVGVLAFDSLPWWVFPPGPVNDQDELSRLIGSIQAGGGTEIYPPLLSAYQSLREMPTKVKHIILLTDGMSASGGNYQELLSDLRSAGISLSTVAVGSGADAGMLQALAELGRGRFYATADADNIPSIFTKETLMATRSFAVNERFYPQVAHDGLLLRGLDAVPPLDGYITVTPKNLAETLLVSPKGDPVLSAWQYGLGRSVAWTPDTGGRWSSDWAVGEVFPRLWGNVLSWILPAESTGSLRVQAEAAPGAGQGIQIEVEDPQDWQEVRQLEAVITGPDGATSTVPLKPAGPGRYEAVQSVADPGAYLLAVTGGDGDGERMLARTGVVVPYPPEYRETGVDMEALRAIALAGGGTLIENPEQVFAENLSPVRARRDLTVPLLAAAALLWLGDIAGRRLVLGPDERAALRRRRKELLARLLPGNSGNTEKPAWTGATLDKVQDLRRSRKEQVGQEQAGQGQTGRSQSPEIGKASGTAATAATDHSLRRGTAGTGTPTVDGYEEMAPPGGAEVETAGDGGDKSESGETETASRLLEAKRRRFK